MNRRTALQRVLALASIAGLGARPASARSAPAELLMFDDPGCGYCLQWHREVGSAYRNSAEGQRAPLRVLQLRAARPADIALAAPVRATPTFVLVQDGREIGRITGYPGPDFFWGLLEPLMRKLERVPSGSTTAA